MNWQHNSKEMNGDLCRLCGGSTVEMFRAAVLEKYAVRYARCSKCESAQTERPYWLAESYADDRPLTDTGMVTRTLELAMKTHLVLSILTVPKQSVCLDIGGSTGLFTRMMRDRGYDFYRSEPFSQNFYAPFHDAAQRGIAKASVVTAFEVFEHFPEPAKEIDELFQYSPEIVIVGTCCFTGQPPQWWYFAPDLGQHVFFYSHTALRAIAERYGMQLISSGNSFHVLCRKQTAGGFFAPEHLESLRNLLQDQSAFLGASVDLSVEFWQEPYKYAQEDRQKILAGGTAGIQAVLQSPTFAGSAQKV